jgi:hypothetical protein
MTEHCTGAGNLSQIVLELDADLDAGRLAAEWTAFARHLPLLAGRLGRDWNLAPYWRLPGGGTPAIRLETRDLGPDAPSDAVWRAIEQPVNTPLRSPGEHVVAHWVRGGGRRRFTLVFDHRLLDARGAEAFLWLFQRWCETHDPDAVCRVIPPPEPAHLDRWVERFRSGRQALRFLRGLSRADLRHFPPPRPGSGRGYRYRLLPLGEEESRQVLDAAFQGAGYLMLMPYVLAAVCRAMHGAFERRGVPRTEYVIPVSVDLRPAERSADTVFFNHLSFFLFRVSRELMEDREKLFASLRRQLYDQMKDGMPRALRESALLTRILPLRAMDRAMLLPLRGQLGSFCFAYVGDTAYAGRTLLQAPIRNLFHTPRVPLPPGLGFFFSNFHGRLNGVLSYLDGLLEDSEAEAIVAAVHEGLR